MHDEREELRKALKLRPEAQRLLDLADYFREYRWKFGRTTPKRFCMWDMIDSHFKPELKKLFNWDIEEEDNAHRAIRDLVYHKLPSCHNCECDGEQYRYSWEQTYKEVFDVHYDLSKSTEKKRAEFNALKETPKFQELIRNMFAQQKYTCLFCSSPVIPKYHIDHLLPLSKGGSNRIENLAISCPSCNLKKKDRVDEMFSLDPEYVTWIPVTYKEDIWMPSISL